MLKTFKKLNRSLSSKIAIAFLFCTFTFSIILLAYNYWNTEKAILQNVGDDLRADTVLVAMRIQDGFDNLKGEIRFLSQTPPLQGIIRALKNRQMDPYDGSTLDQWKDRLQTIFISVLNQRRSYSQIRLIEFNNRGIEVVRVDADRDSSTVFPTPKDKLQHKDQESYFQDAKKLKEGEVYFSKVTYNREYEKLDPRLIPMLRVIVPIFDNDTPFGFIVINIDYQHFIEKSLKDIPLDSALTIVNEQGDYFQKNVGAHESTFNFSGSANYKQSQFIEDVLSFGEKERHFDQGEFTSYSYKLVYNDQDPKGFIAAVLTKKKSHLLAKFRKVRNQSLYFAIVLLFVSSIAFYFVIYTIILPLGNMTKSISLGPEKLNDSLKLPVSAPGEIGALARALAANITTSRRISEAVLNRISEALLIVDENGAIVDWNPSATSLLEVSPNQLSEQDIRTLFSTVDLGTSPAGNTQIETVLKTQRGSSISVELTSTPFFLKERKFKAFIIKNITERVEHQKNVETLLSKLKDSNEELKRFAYLAAHDLKSPLRAIYSLSYMIQSSIKDGNTESCGELIDLLQNRTVRMQTFLDDLLSFSTLDSRDFSSPSIRFTQLIDEIASDLNASEEISILINVEPQDFFVTGIQWRIIFQNLIENAIKHNTMNDFRVEIGVGKISDDSIEFWVKDNGPGIEPQYHARIFEIFQTLQSRDKSEGSGIGLSVVKKLVEKMEGTIRVESEVGKGSKFTITFPKKVISLTGQS